VWRCKINLRDEHNEFILVRTLKKRVIALHLVLLYYAINFDAPDKLWAATFIDFRIVL
jgi:hypothetical protein